MSLTSKKYSDKSYVVRGDILLNPKVRKELTQTLLGNCIWNTKLEGGKGLLVTINEHNEKAIEEFINKHNKEEKGDKVDNSDVVVNCENDVCKIEKEDKVVDKVDKVNNDKVDNDKTDLSLEVKNKLNKISDELNFKRSPKYNSDSQSRDTKKHHKSKSLDKKSDKRTDKKGSDKRSKYSDDDLSENSVSSRSKNSRNYRKSHRLSDDSDYNSNNDSDYNSEEDSDYTPRSSRRSYSSSDTRNRDYSSSDSDNSDEEHRINLSLRERRNNKNKEPIEITEEIDSDNEDVITLSRRLRFVLRKLSEIENKIPQK